MKLKKFNEYILNESAEETAFVNMSDGIKQNDMKLFMRGFNEMTTQDGNYLHVERREPIEGYERDMKSILNLAVNTRNMEVIRLLSNLYDENGKLKIVSY
jgi:hypothetical protein